MNSLDSDSSSDSDWFSGIIVSHIKLYLVQTNNLILFNSLCLGIQLMSNLDSCNSYRSRVAMSNDLSIHNQIILNCIGLNSVVLSLQGSHLMSNILICLCHCPCLVLVSSILVSLNRSYLRVYSLCIVLNGDSYDILIQMVLLCYVHSDQHFNMQCNPDKVCAIFSAMSVEIYLFVFNVVRVFMGHLLSLYQYTRVSQSITLEIIVSNRRYLGIEAVICYSEHINGVLKKSYVISIVLCSSIRDSIRE
jgi:hypothetical protein